LPILVLALLLPLLPGCSSLILEVTRALLKTGARSRALAALAADRQTEKQDCGSDCHRTHSFRVGCPVH